MTDYSIAEAKNNLPQLIHKVEEGTPVQFTRRGKPVAVLLSTDEYQRMRQTLVSPAKALQYFLSDPAFNDINISPELFDELRPKESGRAIDL